MTCWGEVATDLTDVRPSGAATVDAHRTRPVSGWQALVRSAAGGCCLAPRGRPSRATDCCFPMHLGHREIRSPHRPTRCSFRLKAAAASPSPRHLRKCRDRRQAALCALVASAFGVSRHTLAADDRRESTTPTSGRSLRPCDAEATAQQRRRLDVGPRPPGRPALPDTTKIGPMVIAIAPATRATQDCLPGPFPTLPIRGAWSTCCPRRSARPRGAARPPALSVWLTKDVAFRDAESRRWKEVLPNHRATVLERRRALHPGGRSRRDRPGDPRPRAAIRRALTPRLRARPGSGPRSAPAPAA
jgi:hypothetical protein